MKKFKKYICISIILFVVSIIFTLMVKNIDVNAIGPEGSSVGFSTINQKVHDTFNYNEKWYKISKYCGMIPIMLACFYVGRGIKQLIQKKSLKNVDKRLYALGALYILFVLVYFFFEKVIINYRPILEDGKLEASYPSTHTLLAICLCGSSILISKYFIDNKIVKNVLNIFTIIIMIIIVVGRIFSGVHWFTDIIGGIIISLCMLSSFYTIILKLDN